MSPCRRDFIETTYMPEKYNEIWENVKIVSKKNLIVNLYIMKNI